MKKGLLFAALAVAGLAISPVKVDAQVGFGAEAMFGTETDFGIGGRVLVGVSESIPLDLHGGFNIFFPDGPRDYWEINGNLWYTIETSGQGNPYVGGGLNIGSASADGSETNTELALNLGGGYRFNYTNTSPFIEARFALGGHEQFVIGGGVAFGGF